MEKKNKFQAEKGGQQLLFWKLIQNKGLMFKGIVCR